MEKHLVLSLGATAMSETVTLPSESSTKVISSDKKRERTKLGLYRAQFQKPPNTIWHPVIQSEVCGWAVVAPFWFLSAMQNLSPHFLPIESESSSKKTPT